MGRTKTSAKAGVTERALPKNSNHNNNAKASPSKTPAPTVASLTTKAQALMGQMDFEMARKFIVRILEQEPNHVEGREMMGVLEVEEGNIDAASQLFRSLIPPSPTAAIPPSYSAYLYLAQLTDSDPRDALAYYQLAVDVLLSLIKGKDRGADVPSEDDSVDSIESDLKRTVIRALVAMVEIWMTSDLCFEPEAESTCDHLITLAIQADSENVEALESLASVRMSQNKPEEARTSLDKAWNTLKDLDNDDPRMPPIQTLLSLTRRFLELSLFPQALVLIQSILASDDEEIDAWYLQGWCFFLMAQQVKETGQPIDDLGWAELARDSRDCLEACQLFYKQGEHEDEDLINHVRELIGELEASGIHPSPEEVDEDGGEDGGEEDWEDEEDGDVEMG